jgi:hypothetical protein
MGQIHSLFGALPAFRLLTASPDFSPQEVNNELVEEGKGEPISSVLSLPFAVHV